MATFTTITKKRVSWVAPVTVPTRTNTPWTKLSRRKVIFR